MKSLLNNQKRNKKFIRKEVKKMKRIGVLTAAIFLLVGGLNAFALDPTSPIVSTTQTSTIHVESIYNPYGVAISSTEVTTTITTTTNEKGETSTTTTISTSKSEWRGGSLKIISVTGTSDTTASDDSSSHTDFWTNYEYNDKGQLKGASGGSKSKGDRGKDADGQKMGTYESSTTDNYIIKNGQALRSSSKTTGTNYRPDGTKTSDFTETTNYSYQLIGGSWHIMGEVSTSTTNGVDGSTTTITKTRTYSRDANGVATGISQTATGTMTVVNENGGRTTYTMKNYQATFAYDPEVGWYLQKESYDWKPLDKQPYDPWTMGTLTMVDGHLALVVNPDDVNGISFYKMDPSKVTGETKKDENGNLIFMLAVEDGKTQAELESLVGKEVNLMWQYYTKSSDEGASGYGWIHLAPTSDWRVAYHLKNDSISEVQQWGGNWDRSKQYVVID
jgi:hypothetical protein